MPWVEIIVGGLGLLTTIFGYLKGRSNNAPFDEALKEASKANEALGEKYLKAMGRIRTLEKIVVKYQRKYNETLTDGELLDLANSVAGLPSSNGGEGPN